MLAELEDKVAGEILDRRDRSERFGQALGLEPVEARLLELYEVGHLKDVRNLPERVPFAFGSRLGALFDGERARRHWERRGHNRRSAVAVAQNLERRDGGSLRPSF